MLLRAQNEVQGVAMASIGLVDIILDDRALITLQLYDIHSDSMIFLEDGPAPHLFTLCTVLRCFDRTPLGLILFAQRARRSMAMEGWRGYLAICLDWDGGRDRLLVLAMGIVDGCYRLR